MLSYQRIAAPQAPQREPGCTTDRSWGSRWITTLRKLPQSVPQRNANPSNGAVKAAASDPIQRTLMKPSLARFSLSLSPTLTGARVSPE
jgi:hypothetical protein